jgi:uncharacterized protein YgiM (DUF1202 family)
MKKNIAVITMLLISISPLTAFSYYFVNNDQINIRADSTIASSSLGLLSKDEQVEVVEQSSGWFKIKLPKYYKAYVWGTYIKRLSKLRGQVLASRLNMRREPSLESVIIGQLPQETVVVVKGKTGDWLEILAYPFATGWVHKKFISENTTEENEKEEMLLSVFIAESIKSLSTADQEEKKIIIDEVTAKGPNTITLIEMYLDTKNETLTYDMINILTRLGKSSSKLTSYFLKKSESTSIDISSVYLDVLQNILEVQEERVAYYYLTTQGKLSEEEIETIREKYRKIHEKNILSRKANVNIL